MYRTVPAWFVRIGEVIPEMLDNVEKTNWVPSNIKDKRFSNWIANARDWNISRNRYWVHQFHYGFLTILKKWCVLVLSKN